MTKDYGVFINEDTKLPLYLAGTIMSVAISIVVWIVSNQATTVSKDREQDQILDRHEVSLQKVNEIDGRLSRMEGKMDLLIQRSEK